MVTKDAAKLLRAELKRKGWSSKDVSVRVAPSCNAIDVEIKSPAVPFGAVYQIARSYEIIERDHGPSAEIIGGRFVDVTESAARKEALTARYEGAVAEALKNFDPESNGFVKVSPTALVRSEKGYIRIAFDGESPQPMNYYSIADAAHAIALHDEDQR